VLAIGTAIKAFLVVLEHRRAQLLAAAGGCCSLSPAVAL